MPIGTPTLIGVNANTTAGATVVVTTTGPVFAGDSVICLIYLADLTETVLSVTDSAGHTYAVDVTHLHSTAPRRIAIASCHNHSAFAAGGTITATLSASIAGAKVMDIITVSGLTTTGTLDKTSAADGTGTTWSTGSTGTLSQADEFAVAGAVSQSSTASTPDSGWTEDDDRVVALNRRLVMQHQIVSSTAALNSGGTWGNAVWVGAIATYRGYNAPFMTAGSADATASGDPATMGTPAVPGVMTAGSAEATADGGSATMNSSGVIIAGPGSGTASGDTAALVGGIASGLFTVQITPLIRPDPGFVDPADIVAVTQFSDLDVAIPWKGYKTAKVTLRMEDPAVEGLQPFAFALRVLYENRVEPVFWGQSNIIDDFENGLCHLEAQDGSLRMMHHYLRRGDDAINDNPEQDKGTINADKDGLELCIDAAQNIATQDARNDPSLGVIASPTRVATPRAAPIVVERGQECWEVAANAIGQAELGPDIDMETPEDLANYTEVATYDPGTMGTDRTSATPDTPAAGEVVLSYGMAEDDMLGPDVRPVHPTTHVHVLSEDARYRVTAAATAASHDTGGFIDWIRKGVQVDSTEDLQVLTEFAQAHVRAYGVPLRHTTVTLRPDVVITHNFGRPTFTPPAGTRVPTFYLGDSITVRAERGYRTLSEPMRVNGSHLTWPGWQGPALTVLELIPVADGDVDDEES